MLQRVLVIQLARLGDLVQTIPAITALKEAYAEWGVDLLCPASLEHIGQLLPGISRVVKWDGVAWNQRAMKAEAELRPEHLGEADAELRAVTHELYDCAFVLNQHARAILAGALLAKKSIGTIAGGQLAEKLSPWATYVRAVASDRKNNRIHLADAFCGMCGLVPPKRLMPIEVPAVPLPVDLDPIGQSEGPWIGVLVGAGDQERLVPVTAWERLLADCLDAFPRGRIVLVGHVSEQERAQWIQESLPPSLIGRVWDTTGRLSLTQLAVVLTRCQIVVGTDTGPLHLAAAVGTQVIGWYFARARVHETGPYGSNHWVWQAENGEVEEKGLIRPSHWPIEETITLLSKQAVTSAKNWSLWASHRDRWGAYYVEAGHEPIAPPQREKIWQDMQLSSV
jgi:ADP-heptose:LPS heptosyltransferase